jgi:hypothetical protein
MRYVVNSRTQDIAIFKDIIAPKIARHISKPIKVWVSGDDNLTAWLIEHLSAINSLHVSRDPEYKKDV